METTYLNDSIILKTLKKNPNPIVRRLYTIKTELSNATLKRIKKKEKKKEVIASIYYIWEKFTTIS